MGMKVTIKSYVVAEKDLFSEKVNFLLWPYKPTEDNGIVLVRETEVEIEVPDDFDIRPSQIAALQKKEQELRAKFAAAVTEIHRQISELQAIGCEVSA